MVTDLIADLIIRLKNASDAKKPVVDMPYSKFAENVAHALKKAGYVDSVATSGKLFSRSLQIGLMYYEGTGARIHGVDRISKPSRRVYQKSSDIRTYRSGFGNTFLSTPKGVMADEEARKLKVGGEVLFKIW
ncbi:MAG: ribosomal protein small subunit ribosomal protein [Candidatus Parcubacteria bacterium]|nr:ribosomal protein small subunit ribosomal protein [Candidatus Parcubacteria bacterium]